MTDAAFLSIARLHAGYRSRALTAQGVTEQVLARIQRHNSSLGCFWAVDADGARAAAAACDARIADGDIRPLEGVPVGIKDNLDVKGLATTAGIGARRQSIAGTDAAVVRQLKAAGAVILGKLAMDEGALGASGINPHFGDCHNPHDLSRSAGGSSSGSAAAVAAGLCTAALGTDTMGSVRIPAAYCGIYGLKTTPGLVANAGLLPLSPRLDVIGPLARSLADLAAVMAVIAADAPPARPLERIATLSALDTYPLDPAVRSAYDLAAALLAGLDCAVTRLALAPLDFAAIRRAGLVIAEADGAALLAADRRRDPAGFSPAFAALLDYGAALTAERLAEAETRMAAAATELHSALLSADALLLPTTPAPAFAFADGAPDTAADLTAVANIAGLPAITVPMGWSADGLPVAVQLVGRSGTDLSLVQLATRLDTSAGGYQPPHDLT